MTTWNYRIINHDVCDSTYWALHEVFYDEDGSVESWTIDPISFISDESSDDLVRSLETALKDARRHPALNMSELPQ